MRVLTLWGKRRESYEGEYAPELMVAWDEYSLDENYAGYEDEKAEAIGSWGDGLEASREVWLEIPDLEGLFTTPTVNVSVVKEEK